MDPIKNTRAVKYVGGNAIFWRDLVKDGLVKPTEASAEKGRGHEKVFERQEVAIGRAIAFVQRVAPPQKRVYIELAEKLREALNDSDTAKALETAVDNRGVFVVEITITTRDVELTVWARPRDADLAALAGVGAITRFRDFGQPTTILLDLVQVVKPIYTGLFSDDSV